MSPERLRPIADRNVDIERAAAAIARCQTALDLKTQGARNRHE